MQNIALVLGLVKVALEVFQDERRGRFARKLADLEREWNDEMALPDDERSDLALDRILLESRTLGQEIIDAAKK